MIDHPTVHTILCLTSYEKGGELMQEAKRHGWRVMLLTVPALENADWPRESIDELHVMPDLSDTTAVCNGVSYLTRTQVIDRIVALDDYDVPEAAALREHLQLPGMGSSLARRMRDKLAMRIHAHAGGIRVPPFVAAFNDEQINQYTRQVSPPWVLKPRMEASSIGIAKVEDAEQVWERLNSLGDRRSHFLLEQFIPGEVYHVDSIVRGGEVVFAEVHQYGRPPMEVFHGGGIAMSRTVPRDSEDAQQLHAMNRQTLAALGMRQGPSHMEFIKGQDGQFYFLEVGARVGGAHTAEMIEAATGINLWREWARLEVLGDAYHVEVPRQDYGGVIVSLARQEHPDTSSYADAEIVYRVHKEHHVGFVLASESPDRIRQLQDEYSARIAQDFAASLPPWEERPAAT